MGLLDWFTKPKPTPPGVIIRSVLGEDIDSVEGVWNLENADLRHRQWAHADLSGMSLNGANCEGINLFGARLVKTSFCRTNLRGAEIAFADATGADFKQADLTDVLMYQTETHLAKFDQALVSKHSDIPDRKFTGTMRMVA
jgi:uncharacterized protein YjbI with pentapeptide repeats